MELNEFIEKFAEEVEIEDASALTPETDFQSLDEWSSLSIMLSIAFFDEYFDKEVNEKDIRTCETIGELYNLAVK